MTIKQSYGIILCQRTPEGIKSLMVRKRTTYNFFDFIVKFGKLSGQELYNCLENMTADELTLLYSMVFSTIWYRIWLEITPNDTFYQSKRNSFFINYGIDGGVYLRQVIGSVKAKGKYQWEWPKGHIKNKRESEITCAIRELYEETFIDISMYKIIPNKTIIINHTTDGTSYRIKYFIALLTSEKINGITMKQIMNYGEIMHMAWFTQNQLVKYSHLEDEIASHFKVHAKAVKNIIKNQI